VSYCFGNDLVCQGPDPGLANTAVTRRSVFSTLLTQQMNDHARGYACNALPSDQLCRSYVDAARPSDARTAGQFLASLIDARHSEPPAGGGGPLDLAFAIDTTGSMADDIAAVKAGVSTIVAAVRAHGTDARFGLVTYRDHPIAPHGDPGDWPGRVELSFTADSAQFTGAVNSLTVGGGNDWPESVYSGLLAATTLPWRSGVTKVVVLLGDAPPHDPEPVTGLSASDATSALVNLDPARLYPVTVGGTAGPIFDQLAAATGGSVHPVSGADEVVGAIVSAIEDATGSPIALLEPVDISARRGHPLRFDGSASYDPDGDIVSYDWDVDGDGTYEATTPVPHFVHAYLAPFEGSLVMRVTDDDGRQALAAQNVNIVECTSGGGRNGAAVDHTCRSGGERRSAVTPLRVAHDPALFSGLPAGVGQPNG
jgi:hypothetical protein